MFYLGLDLGQKEDHSAIAIVEKREQPRGDSYSQRREQTRTTQLLVRRAERVALGTPYPQVVEIVREIAGGPALAGRCALVVDGTGVGAPVVDMLRAAGLGCEITAVTITGGERESRRGVPKRDLMAVVQLALERGELRIARRMKNAGALVRELLDMRMTATGGMGAEGYGEHDDLVIALALACWRARRRENGYRGERLPGI
ncbi:MAG TPA: hypothetical protein VHY84_07905 [Bryobacteraceae bacterium]|jgi:hypothetical protein|nr:hypothetical protein [Bryobacteraceae bacterium]